MFHRWSSPAILALLFLSSTLWADPPVVVSVSRDYQTILDAPATVQVITQEEIRAFNYRSLAEILAAQPAFTVSRNLNQTVAARGYSVMGDFNSRILVLYDNHPLADLEFNSNPMDSFEPGNGLGIDLSQVRQIEIIRGPGFQLYGSGAMLAVINIIPMSAPEKGRLGGAIEVGSQGYESYSANGAYARGDGALRVDFLRRSRRGDDFYYPELAPTAGAAAHVIGLNKAESTSTVLTADYGPWRLTGYGSQTLQEDPSAPYGTLIGTPQPNANTRVYGRLRYLNDLTSKLRLWGRLSWDGYQFRARYYYEDFSQPGGVWKEVDFAKNQSATGELQLDWAASDDHLATVGLQGQSQYMLYQENAAPCDGGTYFRDERDLSVFTAFLQDEWTPADWVTATAMLRYEHQSSFGDFWGPRGSVLLRLSGQQSLKALYGHGYRAPNVYEMHYGDGFLYFGNPELKPEIIDSFEITHDLADTNLQWQNSIFYNRLTQLINQVEKSAVINGAETNIITYGNQDRVELYGGESIAQWRSRSGHLYEIGYSVQFNRSKEITTDIPNAPQHKISGRMMVPLGKEGATWSVESWWLSRRLSNANTSVDPVLLTNTVFRFAPPKSKWAVSAGASNVFDVSYRDPSTSDNRQQSLPQSGRTLFVRGELEF